MSMISRAASKSSLKLNHGYNYLSRCTRSLKSTATDSTPATMNLDSENQQEDQG